MTLTAAQARALDWLPGDGSWRVNTDNMHKALNCLLVKDRTLLAVEYGPYGKDGGEAFRYRLTRQGMRFKMAREGGDE